MLMSKIHLKIYKKNIILIYFQEKNTLKHNIHHTSKHTINNTD
jgi:hypothetical protein